MFAFPVDWRCPLCETAMAQGLRATHVCKCASCGVDVLGSQSETHVCNEAAKQITLRREIEAEATKAQAELANDDSVATLLHEWGTDATKGLAEEQQDANVSVDGWRGFSEFLREQGK